MQPRAITSQPDPVPVISALSAGTVEAWMETCGAIFGLTPLNHDDARKDYISRSWFVDPLTISNSKYFGMAASHRNWHVEESGGQIHVHRYAYGRASVQADGIPIECDTGAITLLDYGRTFSSLHTDNDCQSFFVPYDAIGYRPSDKPHAVVYPANTRMGGLVGREMDNLLAQLKAGASSITHHDIQRFLACVEVAMCPETASASATRRARDSLKRSIQLFIEQRLETTELNTTLILKNFGVSRASLYRMFDAESGVRAYINHRRLVRAVSDLAVAQPQRGQIHKVSERWGFTSDSNFNRMVRREFGVAPGSLFQMPIQYALDASPSSEIQAMMLRRAKPRKLALV